MPETETVSEKTALPEQLELLGPQSLNVTVPPGLEPPAIVAVSCTWPPITTPAEAPVETVGLAFPGHFLVRLSEGPERLILDPFHGGRICTAVELRELLKATAGTESELQTDHYTPVSDRDVLLRLQNNLKARLIQAERYDRAVMIAETMLMLAPDFAELWREAGLLHARLGNMRSAAAALEQVVLRAPDDMARHQAAAMLQQLRSKLN